MRPASRSVPRELRALADAAVEAGWSIRRTRGSHWTWTGPDGQLVISSGTPGCRRGVLNTRSLLKRSGITDI